MTGKKKLASRLSTFLPGAALISLAVFATQAGLDPNPKWGVLRTSCLIVGILLIALASFGENFIQRLKAVNFRRLTAFFGQGKGNPSAATSDTKSGQAYLLAGLINLLVIAIYVWFISAGSWTTWSDTTSFYSQLAESFRHGKLSLLSEPDPALSTLSNPYDPQARQGLHYPWDISFYKGHYYLYWGPVPALILSLVGPVIPGVIGDQYLVFAFTLGLLIFQTLFLLEIQRKFFRNLPGWALATGILVVGFVSPLLWDLNRPTIYEAAITAGQFFFLGGLYFAFTALEKQPVSIWRLSACGAFWSLAVGSRVSQILAVGFMVILMALYLWRTKAPGWNGIIRAMAGLLIPLIAGGVSLGWYNWTRFGSIADFGFTYQLTGRDIHRTYQSLYSPIYIPQNFYNYLFNPFEVIQRFPFIKPLAGNETPILPNYDLPAYYMVEDEITGLVLHAPFLLLALAPLFSRIRRSRGKPEGPPSKRDEADLALKGWMKAGLAGSFLLEFIPLLVFFYAAPRYVVDFIGPLSLLAVAGFWELTRTSDKGNPAGKPVLLLGLLLAVITIALSLSLAFTSHIGRFKYFSPGLIDFLGRLFAR